MHRIQKVLNHNTLMVEDQQQSYLVIDKGIGFGKKSNEWIEIPTSSTIYLLQSQTERGSSQNIVERVEPIFLEISHEILRCAEKKFGKIDKNILLPLSDHIAFAIERIKENLSISNPFSNEIRLLNPEEYEIALQAKDIILKKTGYLMNEEELGYITLHIHSAISDDKIDESMQIALIVKESIEKVEEQFHIQIDAQSLSYSRLLTHLKYMIMRIKKEEKLTLDMDEFVLSKYPTAYHVAEDILKRISVILQMSIPRIEVGFLGLHIQRICDIHE